MFLISKMYRSSLGHTQPPAWWTPEALFQGVQRLEYEAQVADASRFRGGWLFTGKAIPLHAWTGPEGSRRLRLPDFKTIGTRRW